METNYFKQRDEINILKLRKLRRELPPFCAEFFLGIEPYTTPLTRLGYGNDLKIFFQFLSSEIREFRNKPLVDYTIKDLDNITVTHLELFLDYLTLYESNGKMYRNGEKARSRKLSSVRRMLKYFFKKNEIDSNVAEKMDTPKQHESEIIRLEVDEVAKLLDLSEDGDKLTKMQKGFHKHTRVRDFAMLSLFLGTGIRISECVGLNIEDIDFENNSFVITRKGGNRVVLYFNNEVADALKPYVEQRLQNKEIDPKERALFLSLQNRRITVRAVEKLVKKYALLVSPLKHITPHKLRSTFGTNLYRETGDIYVVADVLGHKDVNTTRKHYAAISDDIRRNAVTKVKLRKND